MNEKWKWFTLFKNLSMAKSSEVNNKAYWASPSSITIADGLSCVVPVQETSYSELMTVMFFIKSREWHQSPSFYISHPFSQNILWAKEGVVQRSWLGRNCYPFFTLCNMGSCESLHLPLSIVRRDFLKAGSSFIYGYKHIKIQKGDW